MTCNLIKDCIQAKQKCCLSVECFSIFIILLLIFALLYAESPFFTLSNDTKQQRLLSITSGHIIATPTTSSASCIYRTGHVGEQGTEYAPGLSGKKFDLLGNQVTK